MWSGVSGMTSATNQMARSRFRRGLSVAANAAVLVAIAWAFPRVDSENGGRWLLSGVMCAALSTIWAVHEQRLLGRPRRAQAMVGLRFVVAVALLWSGYRRQKRREAELRQQGLAERAVAASHEAGVG